MSKFQEIESKWKESGVSDMLLAKFKTFLTDESEEGVKSCVELLRGSGDENLCVVLKQEENGQIVLREDLGIVHRLLWMTEIVSVITEKDSVWKPLYESDAFGNMEAQVLGNVEWSTLSELQQKKIVSFSMSLVEVPAGFFLMGALPNDDDADEAEKPRHKVTLTKGMLVCKYVCTQGLYEKVMCMNPSKFKGSTRPVENVSWCDAVLFCNKLSEMEGLEAAYVLPNVLEQQCRYQHEGWDDTVDELSKKVKWNKDANGYRLPTEAEWEYCARGGESHLYAGSNNIDEVAWYQGNSHNSHGSPVGQKKKNGFGIHGMSGNVWEWVWDTAILDDLRYLRGVSLYTSKAQKDPAIDQSSIERVCRSGSWRFIARFSRVSSRSGCCASTRFFGRGFRFLRTLGE